MVFCFMFCFRYYTEVMLGLWSVIAISMLGE